jgi:FkbM family methyltransferase
MDWALQRLAHPLFRGAFPLYRVLYSFYKKVSDRRERDWLRTILSPGDVVADVGANIGIYSCFFSELVGPSGRVHAFEPDPLNFSRLQQSTRGVSNIELENAAVGETIGTIALWQASQLNVDHRTFAVPGEVRKKIDVRLTTLDEVFRDKRLDFIKLDIQGGEGGAFRGATEILARPNRPTVLFEFWPSSIEASGDSPARVLEQLAEITGMAPLAFGDDRLEEFDRSILKECPRTWYTNLILPKGRQS